MRLVTSVLILCSFAFASGASARQAPTAPQRAIVNVTGQLYRAQNNNHYTVFLVTPEGIIMSDPINRDFARYLKAELATRFKVAAVNDQARVGLSAKLLELCLPDPEQITATKLGG